MKSSSKSYIIDEKGEPIGVFLTLEQYQAILNALEELEELKAFDKALASNDEAIPLEQALKEIEKER